MLLEEEIKTKKLDIDSTQLKEDFKVEYQIIRSEVISGSFQQGKIYAVVDEGYSKDALLRTCETIKNIYKEFSNIVICHTPTMMKGKRLHKEIVILLVKIVKLFGLHFIHIIQLRVYFLMIIPMGTRVHSKL